MVSSGEAIVQLKNMGKEFKTSSGPVKALDGINLSIEKGEIFGIIGLSGAGKSTLVRCINYLEEPTSGEVLFQGKSLTQMTARERGVARRSMGMIFQQFNLLSQRTVLDNICFPLEIGKMPKAKARQRAMELLELVDLKEKAKAYPVQLSGGQKQRVAIARAIATNPQVILCDEATSALDPNTTKSILQLLKQINQDMGITIIMITHEMAVIEAICDRVAIIDQSRIAECGEVSRIFSEPKSKIGQQLILGEAGNQAVEILNGRKIRISFDGRSAFEPVLSNLILACKVSVSILHAQIKEINGVLMGQMVISLPDEDGEVARVINYLKAAKIAFEEVRSHGI